MDIDVAVIEIDMADNESLFAVPLPRVVFRDPRVDDELRVFGNPLTLGFTEQPLTVEPGHVVNPEVEVPEMFGEPQHKVFLTSAVERPGNSGGPIAAKDGRAPTNGRPSMLEAQPAFISSPARSIAARIRLTAVLSPIGMPDFCR